MSHILDRPIWTALATRHAHLAQGGPLARRYPPSVSMFTATGDDSAESLSALDELAAEETVLLVQSSEVALPPGLAVVLSAGGVQMLADDMFPLIEDERIEKLGDADAEDMLALATLTKPGPFSLKARSFGDFWGIRENGQLIAMAGERLKQPGLTELSGVCTHPDFQRRGLARLMSLYVAGQISAKGELPYLHSWATNEAAISLYRSIGFTLRTPMSVMIAKRGG